MMARVSFSSKSLQFASCLSWGRRGEGKPEIGGKQRSWPGLSPPLCPALHPALPLNPRPLCRFPQPWKAMNAGERVRAGSGQGHKEDRTEATVTDIMLFSSADYRSWEGSNLGKKM